MKRWANLLSLSLNQISKNLWETLLNIGAENRQSQDSQKYLLTSCFSLNYPDIKLNFFYDYNCLLDIIWTTDYAGYKALNEYWLYHKNNFELNFIKVQKRKQKNEFFWKHKLKLNYLESFCIILLDSYR